VRWRKAGVWDRLMDAITVAHDGDIQMIDSTSVRVHQQAAPAKREVQIAVSVASGAGSRPGSTSSSLDVQSEWISSPGLQPRKHA